MPTRSGMAPLPTNHQDGVGEIIAAEHINAIARRVNALDADYVTPEEFLAVGDREADDSQAVLDAIAAAGGRKLYLAKRYKVTVPINFGDCKPIGDGGGTSEIYLATATARLEFAGSRGARVLLTASAAKGDTTLSVDTTGIAKGDWLVVRSSEAWAWSTAGATHGEQVRVRNVDSATQLTLSSPLVDAYSTANAASIAKVTHKNAPAIAGLEITRDPAALSTNTEHGFLTFKYCREPLIEDCVGWGAEQYVVAWDTCIDGHASRVAVRDAIHDSSISHYGYGLLMRGPSQGMTLDECTSSNAQLINGGGTTDGGPRYVKASDCVAQGSDGTSGRGLFNTHGDCHMWTFDGCSALNSASNEGFNIKGEDNTVNDPTIVNVAGAGVAFLEQSLRGALVGGRIENIKGGVNNTGSGVIFQGAEGMLDGTRTKDTDAYGMLCASTSTKTTLRTPQVAAAGRSWTGYAGIRASANVTDILVRDPTLMDMPAGTGISFGGTNTGSKIGSQVMSRNVGTPLDANATTYLVTGGSV